MDKYQWIAVLDSKTTAICQDRDGDVYSFGDGPMPPAHINCRSTITGYDENETDVEMPASINDWIAAQPDAETLAADQTKPITSQAMSEVTEALNDVKSATGMIDASNYQLGGLEDFLRASINLMAADENEVVYVDVAKVDALWSKTGFRIAPAPEGENSKLDRAKAFISNLKPGESFKVPQLGVGKTATHIGFDDGRHRFAAMRDLGYEKAPVSMDPQSITNARNRGLLAK